MKRKKERKRRRPNQHLFHRFPAMLLWLAPCCPQLGMILGRFSFFFFVFFHFSLARFRCFRDRGDEHGRVYLRGVDHRPRYPAAEHGRPVQRVLQLLFRRLAKLNPTEERALQEQEEESAKPERHFFLFLLETHTSLSHYSLSLSHSLSSFTLAMPFDRRTGSQSLPFATQKDFAFCLLLSLASSSCCGAKRNGVSLSLSLSLSFLFFFSFSLTPRKP